MGSEVAANVEYPKSGSEIMPTRKLLLKVVRARNLPKTSCASSGFYVVVTVDNENSAKVTAVVSGRNAVEWSQVLSFEITSTSELALEIYLKRRLLKDEKVGEFRELISSVLASAENGDVSRNLRNFSASCSIDLRVVAGPELTHELLKAMGESVRDVVQGVKKQSLAPNPLRQFLSTWSCIAPTDEQLDEDASTWDSLLRKVDLFVQLVDKLVEVHPYAKTAWCIISVIPRVLIAQVERDENVASLVETMDDTFSFVDEAEPLRGIHSLNETLKCMAQQTIECCDFIRSYCKDPTFWRRTLTNLASGVDAQIKEYKENFQALKEKFHGRVLVNIQVSVLRFLGTINILTAEVILNDMPYAAGARFRKDKGCLPGTREEFMDEIFKWAYNSDDQRRVCLLLGRAGSGKSSIAHTMARHFHELERLGSSFCFDRNYLAERRPDLLFCTIARDLADRDPCFRRELAQVIRDRSLRTTRDITTQFEDFILEPLKRLTLLGPIFIVIDALDESGTYPKNRHQLVSLINKRMSELPANFRILITSRPEVDVEKFDAQSVHCVRLDDIPLAQTNRDILAYVRFQLTLPPRTDPVIDDKRCRRLADMSEGLFQWAFVACEYIKTEQMGSSFSKRFRKVTEASAVDATKALDRLYSTVLSQYFIPDDDDGLILFRSVMGQILAAFEPISIASLADMRQRMCRDQPASRDSDSQLSEVSVISVVKFMGSLLSGTQDPSMPLRPLHTSFRDFLTDEERGGPFYVGSKSHSDLALATLRILNDDLRFNICRLDSSYLRNKDIADLTQRVQSSISPPLSYACRFWADHLRLAPFDPNLYEEVKVFFFHKLLYWLEALSLLQSIGRAASSLSFAMEWFLMGRNSATEEYKLASDAQNFVRKFGSAISHSTPHLYVSALPFSPEHSIISRHFRNKTTRHTPHVLSARAKDWPQCQNVLMGHDATVSSVAFSPDGRHVVSGSDDNTVRIWLGETGEMLGAPLKGHVERVWTVAFSPDGKRIASGSADQTIRFWDVEMFEAFCAPLHKHSNDVFSVAFSCNGKQLVSGSGDHTVRIWNTNWESGEIVPMPAMTGHAGSVRSVMFTVDGCRILSGSEDQTIRIWNSETRQTVHILSQGHTGAIRSVAFSPSGKYVASASEDCNVCVWNIETNTISGTTLHGHTDVVSSVAFSPDGQHVVSGSYDTSIRIWDIEAVDKSVHSCLQGHTRKVHSVAFSRDGRRIVSGSEDWALRIWNAKSGENVPAPLPGHSDTIFCIRFSPDSKHIASASYDQTVRVWDVQSGEPVGSPLCGHSDVIWSVSFSPDGKRIASGSSDRTVRVWDWRENTSIFEPFQGHTDSVFTVAYSPDGALIVSGSQDHTLRVWNAEAGEAVGSPLQHHTETIWTIAFSRNGKQLVSGSFDHTICVWDVLTWKIVGAPLKGHKDKVASVRFCPAGKHIVSGSTDGEIFIWDADTGIALFGPLLGHTGRVLSIAFSPDGDHFVSGASDNSIRMWDAVMGKAVGAPLRGHADWIQSVAFSPNGQHVASGASDKTIRFCDPDIWRAVTASEQRSIPVSFSRNTSLSLSLFHRLIHESSTVDPRCLFWMQEDRWLVGPNKELLLWIPHEHYQLYHPWNTLAIGREITELDLSHLAHGTNWTDCFNA